MSNVLVIDAEQRWRERILHFFKGYGHDIHGASNVSEALTVLQERNIEVIVIDIAGDSAILPDIMRIAQMDFEHSQVIVTADSSNMHTAIMSVREGAFDYLPKPYNVAELYLKVEKALEVRRLRLEAQNLRGEQPFIYSVNDIIGESPKIKALLKTVGKHARSDSRMHINGENGTGKELFAALVHFNSYRRKYAFTRVNCALLQGSVLESELFGHERDAHDKAYQLRIGKLEQADGGTLYISNLECMPADLQEDFLQFLQEGTFFRRGGIHPIKVNVRIITSSHLDLKREVLDGRFSKELFSLLSEIELRIPPLRERREDIYPLVHFFIRKYGSELNSRIQDVSAEAMEALYSHSWPGNVLELRNCMERALLLTRGKILGPADLNMITLDAPARGKKNYNLELVEKKLIQSALRECDFIQKSAARLLGISRRSLNYRIRKYNLRHDNWRRNS